MNFFWGIITKPKYLQGQKIYLSLLFLDKGATNTKYRPIIFMLHYMETKMIIKYRQILTPSVPNYYKGKKKSNLLRKSKT
jgi:hypothetical protein